MLAQAGRAVDGVVGAHHRFCVAVDHGGAKRGQVGVLKIARATVDVEPVALGLRPAVHGEMLGGGDRFEDGSDRRPASR